MKKLAIISLFNDTPTQTQKDIYKEPGTLEGPPWTRGRYEELDYIIISNKFKNFDTGE